jgi:hypothetical protein
VELFVASFGFVEGVVEKNLGDTQEGFCAAGFLLGGVKRRLVPGERFFSAGVACPKDCGNDARGYYQMISIGASFGGTAGFWFRL